MSGSRVGSAGGAGTTVAQRIGAFGSATRFVDLPPAVVASVRQRVIDTFGIMLAASAVDSLEPVWRLVLDAGGAPEASTPVSAARVPATSAAFVGGLLSHALDFDDTHLPSILHPSAVIVPTALAAAELAGAGGEKAVTAMAVGYEVLVRLGMAAYDPALKNSVYFEKGLHATSICGAVAGAAVASRLLDGSARHMADAMGIAASMGAGLLEANRTGGTVKRVHGAWACQAAVWAARLATAGITGPPTVFEGRFGFFYYLMGEAALALDPAAGLGEEWHTPGIFFKPYPVNHFIHTAIDAARALRARAPLPWQRITAVELGVAGATLRTIAEPRGAKLAPKDGYSARFSAPFVVATALLSDGHGLGLDAEDFGDAAVRDPDRLQLAALVTCHSDPECEALFPYEFPCRLTVRYDDGTSLEEWVPHNRGGPGRPLTEDEVLSKFRSNAGRAFPPETVAAVEEALVGFERLADVKTSFSCLRRDADQS